MKRIQSLINEVGVGLVEVMIASGILTVLMLGVANMMTSSAKTSHSIEKGLGWDELVAMVSQQLNNPIACTQMLNRVKIKDGAPFALCIGGPNTSCTTGVAVGPNSTYGGIAIGATPIPAAPNQTPNPTPMMWRVPPPGVPATGGSVVAYFTIDGNLQGSNPRADAIVGGGIRTTDTIAPKGLMVTANVNSLGEIVSCGPGNSSGIQVGKLISGVCTTGHTSGGSCYSAVYWNTPFPSSNYTAVCTLVGPPSCNGGCTGGGGTPAGLHIVSVVSQSPGSVTLELATGAIQAAQSSTVPEIDCIGVPF